MPGQSDQAPEAEHAAPAPVLEEDEGDEGDGGEHDEEAAREFICPVCNEIFATGNTLQLHYEVKHAVTDPTLVTSYSKQCPTCKKYVARNMKDHLRICPAKLELRQRIELQQGMWLPVQVGPGPPATTGMVDSNGWVRWEHHRR